MSELLPQEFIVHNQAELEDLAWELEASANQFSLMLARCNYTHLREQLVERLRELCPVDIRMLVLQPSETALYTRIQAELAGTRPGALMVFGLETISDLEQLLTNANQVREEFRKNCPFPIVLWVTDEAQRFLIHAAPDLESWATKSYFTLPPNALQQGLQQAIARLFSGLLAPSQAASLETFHPSLDLGWFTPTELRAAVQELRLQEEEPDPEALASLDLIRGLWAAQASQALEYLERSGQFWQQRRTAGISSAEEDLRYGLLLFYQAQAQLLLARQVETEQEEEPDWSGVEGLLREAIALFEQVERPDLVTRCLAPLEQTLQKRRNWDELEAVARRGLELHRQYSNPTRQSQDYGYLARVALERQQWQAARQAGQQALEILAQETGDRRWLRGLYLLFLAEAEQGLGNGRGAIAHLLEANAPVVSQQGYPRIAIRILEALRNLYFEQGQYLEAFHAKQDRLSTEQQYGIRAFIGAGRLQPRKQEVSEFQAVNQDEVALEIAAAGRQQDLTRLMERIGRRDYRLIVIHGSSGVGKSSLVNAGLVPRLQQRAIDIRDNVPIVMRTYTQWMQELERLLDEVPRSRVTESPEPPTAARLLERLQHLDQRNLRTILIFDQFEEFFFVYPQPEQRRAFFDFVSQCLRILSLNVVLSLREDYLHLLLELNRLPGMATTGIDALSRNVLYELGNFSPEDAKAIIYSLTSRAHFHLEAALVDQLVTDLSREVGAVRPIELQVVGAQLQTDGITTLTRYQAEGPDAKQELVKRYLDGVVIDCGPANRQLAGLVLFLLTDEKGTRPLKTRAELEEELQALSVDLDEVEENLDLILQIFVESGLVFLLPENPADRYQLVHDYLAAFIREQQEPRLSKVMAELEQERQQRKASEAKLARLQQSGQVLSKAKQNAKFNQNKRRLRGILPLAISIIVTTGLISSGAWWLGLLQLLELKAFDFMTRARPDLGPDQRLLIVGITEADIEKYNMPLNDRLIAELLSKVQQYKPQVIGLNIFRDLPIEPGSAQLNLQLNQQPNIIGITKIGTNTANDPTIPPPPAMPDAQVGFNDIVTDPDGIVRRNLLFADTETTTLTAFSLQIALAYLASQGLAPRNSEDDPNLIEWGATILAPLGATSGNYRYNDAAGYQILLNYRTRTIAPIVSLSDVLEGKLRPEQVANKIVLIGFVNTSSRDFLYTPYSATNWENPGMPGVEVHAQMISQLLDAVRGTRPLFQFWSEWVKILWIIGWVFWGSILTLYIRYPLLLGLGILLSILVITGISYGLFLQSYWIPLAAPILAFATSIVTSLIIILRRTAVHQVYDGIELTIEAYRDDPDACRLVIEIFLLTSSESKVVAQEMASTALKTLGQCQNLSDIAEVRQKLAWIPPSSPKPFSPEFFQLLEVSQQVQVTTDLACEDDFNISYAQPLKTLQALQNTLNFRRVPHSKALRAIASQWFTILLRDAGQQKGFSTTHSGTPSSTKKET